MSQAGDIANFMIPGKMVKGINDCLIAGTDRQNVDADVILC